MLEKYKYKIANATGIPTLLHFINRKKLLVLTYHGLFDGDIPKTGALPATFVHVDNFAKQMAFIKKKYRVISPDELVESINGRCDLTENSALITFDDGYESFHRLAWPVLKTLDIKGIVFVPTRYLEDRQPFWFDMVWLYIKKFSMEEISWLPDSLGFNKTSMQTSFQQTDFIFTILKSLSQEKRDAIIAQVTSELFKKVNPNDSILKPFYCMKGGQIKELSNQGILFGGHTHSHTILTSMHYLAVKEEISVNKQKLEKLTGCSSDFFAYPNGGNHDFNEEHKTILKDIGYKVGFSLTQARSKFSDDLMAFSRINVNPEDTLDALNFHCTGIIQYIDVIRSVLGNIK